MIQAQALSFQEISNANNGAENNENLSPEEQQSHYIKNYMDRRQEIVNRSLEFEQKRVKVKPLQSST